MSAKDTVIGTAKQFVAEIDGDGRLAEEGSRQTAGSPFPTTARPVMRLGAASIPQQESSHMDENRFAALLGHATLKVWPDLPRDAQERLFAAAADDGLVANELAQFLHDRHPKTAHPPRPTRLA